MVSDKTFRRMMLSCECGHVSRNEAEDSRHRHNYPLECKKPMVRCSVDTDAPDPYFPGQMLQCKRVTGHESKKCYQHRNH